MGAVIATLVIFYEQRILSDGIGTTFKSPLAAVFRIAFVMNINSELIEYHAGNAAGWVTAASPILPICRVNFDSSGIEDRGRTLSLVRSEQGASSRLMTGRAVRWSDRGEHLRERGYAGGDLLHDRTSNRSGSVFRPSC